jgi:integrase
VFFVESLAIGSTGFQLVAGMPKRTTKRRSVKSAAIRAADHHERAKDFLSEAETDALLDAAKAGRHGVRDHLLVLMMYRHGLRVSEAIGLRQQDELDLDQARLWVRRLKGGLSVEQPIAGDELRAIRRYLATRADRLPWLLLFERGQPMTGRPSTTSSPKRRHALACRASALICCGTPVASRSVIAATTCA